MTATIQTVDAVELIRADHRRIKDLFREFETGDHATRRRVCERALEELDAHARMEETLFYPLVSRKISAARDLVLESQEAHHVAKVLLMELQLMPFGARFEAKFKNLITAALAHMEEEETQLLPLVESSRIDTESLGRKMADFKSRHFYGEGLMPGGRGPGLGSLLVLGLIGAAAYYAFSE